MRALTPSRALGPPICVVLWLALLCAPALAHASLVQETPAAGASLDQPPGQVRLTFSEPVDAEFDPLKVYDAEGNRVDVDDARVDPDDARVLVAGLEELPEGSYRVEWRVTSIDGHVIEDAYAFNVSAAAGENGGGSQADAGGQADRGAQGPASREDAGALGPTIIYGVLIIGVLGLVALAVVAVRALRRRKARGVQ